MKFSCMKYMYYIDETVKYETVKDETAAYTE